MSQLLIISPDAKLIEALQRGFSETRVPKAAWLLRSYPSPQQLNAILHRKRPSAVIVGLSDSVRALELIACASENFPKIRLAGAHTENESDLILRSVRKGAHEFLGPPFAPQDLERAVSSRTATKVGGRQIVFVPAVAGSGASTVALHVASALSKQAGSQTLLVDFDFHSGAADFRLKLKPRYTLADALERDVCTDEVWSELVTRWNGIDLLPSPPPEAPIRAEDLTKVPSMFEFASKTYKWTVVDLPAAVYGCCRDILAESETVYLVSTPDIMSLHMAKRRLDQLLAACVTPGNVHLVINRFSEGQCLSVDEIRKIIGIRVACTLNNDYQALSRVCLKGELLDESTGLGQQLREFARQICGASVAPKPPERKSAWKRLLSPPASPSLSRVASR
jgi:Flp pilus assembly CpaE family ATPase